MNEHGQDRQEQRNEEPVAELTLKPETACEPADQEARRADSQPEPEAPAPEVEPEAALTAQSDKSEAESAAPEQEPEAVREEKARPADPASADDVLTKRMPGRETADSIVLAESRRHTRRSFMLAGAAAAVGVGFYKWLDVEPSDDMQPGLLRRTFQANAAVSRGIGRDHVLTPHLSPESGGDTPRQWHLWIEDGAGSGELAPSVRRCSGGYATSRICEGCDRVEIPLYRCVYQ